MRSGNRQLAVPLLAALALCALAAPATGDPLPSWNDGANKSAIIIHHTDADREFAYDRESHMGRLDQAMEDAPAQGWLLIDMKHDWNTIYHD